jgi:dolichol-phosphate mannosyltransferase
LTSGSVELSVVVPVYNEEDCLPEFHRRTLSVLDRLGLCAEIIYVDDGSADSSAVLLGGLAGGERVGVRVLTLSRNFGHQIAVSAGLDASTGQAVVVIDSDLQDPPEVIPELVEKWRGGVDVVHAVRAERRGETLFKRMTARFFYKGVRALTDLNIQVDAGDFRLMDRVAVDAICAMPERFRFVRGLAAWVGFKQDTVEYVRDERFAGTTKYPIRRMFHLAATAVTSFSFVPLQFASVMGFIVSTLAVLAIPVVIVLRIAGVSGLSGQTTVLLAVLLLGGLQLMVMGVVGEYVGRMYIEVKHRPLYLLDPRRSALESDPQHGERSAARPLPREGTSSPLAAASPGDISPT